MCTHPKLFYLHPLFSPLCLLCHLFCLLAIYAAAGVIILLFFPLDFLSTSVSLLVLLCLTSGRLCPLVLSQWTLMLLMWDNGTHLKGYRTLCTVSIRTPSSLFPSFDLGRTASLNVTWATQKILFKKKVVNYLLWPDLRTGWRQDGHFTLTALMAAIFKALL